MIIYCLRIHAKASSCSRFPPLWKTAERCPHLPTKRADAKLGFFFLHKVVAQPCWGGRVGRWVPFSTQLGRSGGMAKLGCVTDLWHQTSVHLLVSYLFNNVIVQTHTSVMLLQRRWLKYTVEHSSLVCSLRCIIHFVHSCFAVHQMTCFPQIIHFYFHNEHTALNFTTHHGKVHIHAMVNSDWDFSM